MEHVDTPIRTAIFGSCVSRDSCEFVEEIEVVCYVARQSVITSLHAAGETKSALDELASPFQRKMLRGDMLGDGVDRIVKACPDLILVDLVDERSGVWRFPNGGYLTNSIEAERTGVNQWATQAGAKLIEFGSDEHFELWKQGFNRVMTQLLGEKAQVILVDLEWATTIEGAKESTALPSRLIRRLRFLVNSPDRRQSTRAVLRKIQEFSRREPTIAKTLATTAKQANRRYKRYRRYATLYFAGSVVRRERNKLMMSPTHKWGLAPYHYRSSDYERIAEKVRKLTRGKDSTSD